MSKFSFYAGVDAGGTQCRVRLTDPAGQRLAETTGGPANLYQQGEQAFRHITVAIDQALASAGFAHIPHERVAVGIGAAGAELPESQALVNQWQHPFGRVVVQNDAHTACLGAHKGADGGLVIVGTGIVGWSIQGSASQMLDGWGFPLADQGSGAWLGMRALQETLRSSDGIRSPSPLTARILAHFGQMPRRISSWASTAKSADYGFFARWVVEAAADGDPLAAGLRQEQADAVSLLLHRLIDLGVERIALLGGLAPFVEAVLATGLKAHLVPPQQDALTGALLMVRSEA